jgi:hypothetical protein
MPSHVSAISVSRRIGQEDVETTALTLLYHLALNIPLSDNREQESKGVRNGNRETEFYMSNSMEMCVRRLPVSKKYLRG